MRVLARGVVQHSAQAGSIRSSRLQRASADKSEWGRVTVPAWEIRSTREASRQTNCKRAARGNDVARNIDEETLTYEDLLGRLRMRAIQKRNSVPAAPPSAALLDPLSPSLSPLLALHPLHIHPHTMWRWLSIFRRCSSAPTQLTLSKREPGESRRRET
jgi:hypothetical protein